MAEALLGFVASFAAGCAGYWLLNLIRFPAAAIMGSMIATGFLNVTGWTPHFDSGPLAYICAVGIGMVVGRHINRQIALRAGSMVRPVLVQITCHMLLALACGYIFYKLAPHNDEVSVSLITSLIGTSTGGLTEMLVFGLSIGGDISIIAFMQMVRMVTFLSLLPYSSKLAIRLGDKRMPALSGVHGGEPHAELALFSRREYLLLIILAFTGGYIGLRLHLPAGSLLGSMFFSGVLSIYLNKSYNYKPAIRELAQIGLGMVMGQRVNADVLSSLSGLFLPIIVVTVVMLAGCLALAFVQYRTTKYDLATCLLCSAPAGLSQVAIYADEAGSDVLTASMFQTARLVSVVLIYPWLILHLI